MLLSPPSPPGFTKIPIDIAIRDESDGKYYIDDIDLHEVELKKNSNFLDLSYIDAPRGDNIDRYVCYDGVIYHNKLIIYNRKSVKYKKVSRPRTKGVHLTLVRRDIKLANHQLFNDKFKVPGGDGVRYFINDKDLLDEYMQNAVYVDNMYYFLYLMRKEFDKPPEVNAIFNNNYATDKPLVMNKNGTKFLINKKNFIH